MIETGTWILCSTDKDQRGVFYGRLADRTGWEEHGRITLADARMVVRWSADTRGYLGLASIGPQGNRVVSPPVPELVLTGVTNLVRCSEDAILRFGEI